MLDWVRKAREQARSVHPDVTAIFLGANDGFPMSTPSGASVACCGAGWVAEYARRVEAMMRSYLRGGRSYVYWMTLPTPRRGNFARVYRAVNRAIRRAGGRVGGGVRVIDLVPVFTPGGRFRQHVTFRGRTVSARQDDGIHLSIAGASIAATLLIDRLRADHALPRLCRLMRPGATRSRGELARCAGSLAGGSLRRRAAAAPAAAADRPATGSADAAPAATARRAVVIDASRRRQQPAARARRRAAALRARARVRGTATARPRRVPSANCRPRALRGARDGGRRAGAGAAR